MRPSLILYDGVCCQVNQHNVKCVKKQLIKEEKCCCCEFGISCRISDHPPSLHDQAESLEDQSVDLVIDMGSTENGDVQASIGGVQSKVLEMEDGAKKPDLTIRFIASYTGFHRGYYRGRYTVLVLAFACLLVVANSTIVETPKNTVILKGKSTNAIDLACKSDRGYNLVWYLNKNQGSEKEVLYNGYSLRRDVEHYCTVITDEPGKCYLNLINTAEAAQTYICLEPGTLAETSADVIWIGDRICHDGSTEDLVNLTCIIEFRGNWAPTMEWKEHSNDGEKVLAVKVNTTTVPNQRVTSTLVMEVQKGRRKYTCTTKFDIIWKPPHTTATNVPDYNRVWTSVVFIRSGDSMEKDHSNILIIVVTAIVAIIIGVLLVYCCCCRKKLRDRKEKAPYV